MSMSLDAEDLLKVQNAVREIKGMQVLVTEFVAAEHKILLNWVNGEPLVVGILRESEHKSHGNLGGNMRTGGR
jgi:hypothetical protein